MSFLWSLGLAAVTVMLLALICYPVAYGLTRVFGRWSTLLTLLFTIPLFVSENVRLYGWILFFIKNGVLLGTVKSLFGIEGETCCSPKADRARHGLCLLALHAVPDDARRQHGAERDARRRLRSRGDAAGRCSSEVDLPLAMPGIVIGFLLSFVLAVGAIAEAKVLGGQQVIPITHDIEIAFTYAQNWPLGAALAVLLMLVVGALVLLVLRRFDLDTILGRR